MDGSENTAERLADIERREREVEKREKAAAAKGLRHNLYEHITCSVTTVDVIIAACAVLIAALTVFGALSGK